MARNTFVEIYREKVSTHSHLQLRAHKTETKSKKKVEKVTVTWKHLLIRDHEKWQDKDCHVNHFTARRSLKKTCYTLASIL
jgi:hypothetical protein